MVSNLVRLRRLSYGLLAVGAAGILLIVGFLAYSAFTMPLSPAASASLSSAAVQYDTSSGTPFAVRGVYHGDPIDPEGLPRDLVNAVIAIEDRRFYEHDGIDLRGIGRAAWNNLLHADVEGGSTITQQLARVTYLSSERSLRRKAQEAMLALWLEARLSKDEILARYLNAVYFGAGAVGADAAAKRYFGKTASELDLAESAMLAGLIRAPSRLAPSRHLKAAQRRATVVLAAMMETGAIDKARYQAALAKPVRLVLTPEPDPDLNYFIDTAEAEIKRLIGRPPLDLSITTTIDPRLQDAALRVVRFWLDGEGARRNVGQAALVAMAPDGAILAMMGGRDYGESQFNRATQARRQPGSLFKIFVYLTALSNGYRPTSVIVDQPVQIGDWQPKNQDSRYRGEVTLRTAFAESINSVAVQLSQAVGVERVIAMAKSLGVASELPPRPDLALGWAEVTLLEMTRAMDAIATNSASIEPYTVREIRTPAGPLYTRPETMPDRPDWNRTAMVRLLEAVVINGTGRAARLDRRLAGKTGTTDDYRDAWFVGFTTNIVVGVWVGNDDNSPMNEVTGGDLPAKIWHDFVSDAERMLAEPPAPAAIEAAVTGSSVKPTKAPPVPVATPVSAATPVPTAAPVKAKPQRLRGVPRIVDTGTLLVNEAPLRLYGVDGEGGKLVEEMAHYVGGREVDCEPVDAGGAQYRCKIGALDLSEAVLLNGAGRAAASAPERLRQAQQKARAARWGIWAGPASEARR